MPFQGVKSRDHRELSFDFMSMKFILAIILTFLSTIEFFIVSHKYFSRGVHFDDSVFFFLNGGGIYMGIYLIVLGSNWPELMSFWFENEKIFISHLYHGRKYYEKFRRKMVLIAVCVMGYGVSELC